MPPTLVPLNTFEPGRLSVPSLTRKTKAMEIQLRLHSRSTAGASSGGLGANTIVFIVLGVVCFLVILIGFYLVGRPHYKGGPDVPSVHQPSPTLTAQTARSQSEHDTSKRWKMWRMWRHTNCTDPATPNTPTSQPSSPPTAISKPSRIGRVRRGPSQSYPPIVVRPTHSRRPTNLSVATSFPHSHVSEEAWSDLRASAYDLDVDLEVEMLHSARDDVWLGHPLAVEGGCGGIGIEEVIEERGNAIGDPPTRLVGATQLGGADYESLGACQEVASAIKRNSENGPNEVHTR